MGSMAWSFRVKVSLLQWSETSASKRAWLLGRTELAALNDDEEGPSPRGKAQVSLAAPAAPTNLRVEAVTDSSGRVRWDAAEGAADYDVNYKPAVGGRWTNEPHRGTGLYNTIDDLAPGTEYRWAVRAENSDGRSAWVFGPNFTTLEDETDETTVDVGADGQAPAAPTNLRFDAPTDSSCTVRWEPPTMMLQANGGRPMDEPHHGALQHDRRSCLGPSIAGPRAENGDGRSAWVFGEFYDIRGETDDGADGGISSLLTHRYTTTTCLSCLSLRTSSPAICQCCALL